MSIRRAASTLRDDAVPLITGTALVTLGHAAIARGAFGGYAWMIVLGSATAVVGRTWTWARWARAHDAAPPGLRAAAIAEGWIVASTLAAGAGAALFLSPLLLNAGLRSDPTSGAAASALGLAIVSMGHAVGRTQAAVVAVRATGGVARRVSAWVPLTAALGTAWATCCCLPAVPALDALLEIWLLERTRASDAPPG